MGKDTIKYLCVYRQGSPLSFITDKNKPELFDSILALGENIDGNDPLTESPLFLTIQRRDYNYAIRLLGGNMPHYELQWIVLFTMRKLWCFAYSIGFNIIWGRYLAKYAHTDPAKGGRSMNISDVKTIC